MLNNREILLFPGMAGNTGKYREILGITGKYWEISGNIVNCWELLVIKISTILSENYSENTLPQSIDLKKHVQLNTTIQYKNTFISKFVTLSEDH